MKFAKLQKISKTVDWACFYMYLNTVAEIWKNNKFWWFLVLPKKHCYMFLSNSIILRRRRRKFLGFRMLKSRFLKGKSMQNDAKYWNFRLRRHLTEISESHEGAKQGGNLNKGGNLNNSYPWLVFSRTYLSRNRLAIRANCYLNSPSPFI